MPRSRGTKTNKKQIKRWKIKNLAQIPWDNNHDALAKWANATTGFPWIDAIMTQLREEVGQIFNRLRQKSNIINNVFGLVHFP